MSKHETAALTALFLDYGTKESPRGRYFVFTIKLHSGEEDICRMDAIHRKIVEPIFESLDAGNPIIGPVERDSKFGYRVDLSCARTFFQKPRVEYSGTQLQSPVPAPEERRREPRPKVRRAQFNVDIDTYERIEALAEAEGFQSYSDWIRAVIDRVLAAKGAV
jgi:hypothetical protein